MEVRLTLPQDIDSISESVETCLARPFVIHDVNTLLEFSAISVSCVDGREVVGFASFFDYPSEKYCASRGDWVTWLFEMTGHWRFKCFNTLFFECFVNVGHERDSLKKVITKIFTAMPLIEFIVILCQKDEEVDESIIRLFTPKKVVDNEITLWLCKRKNLIPLTIRSPVLEDYDDIFRMTEGSRDLFEDHYGPTYPVDFAQYDKENNFTAIAEVHGEVVGFMYAATSRVNLSELNRNFELEAFHGLRKPSKNDDGPTRHAAVRITTKSDSASEQAEDVFGDSDIVNLPSLCERQSAYISAHKNRSVWINTPMRDLSFKDDPYVVEDEESSSEQATDDVGSAFLPSQEPNRPEKHSLPYIPKYHRPAKPKFCGKTNCFRIYFYSVEERYKSEFLSFIMAAFKKLHKWDYCLLMLPYDVPLHSLHHSFFQVAPRPLSMFPQVLFVFHKAGALLDFRVRTAVRKDFPGIRRLVDTLYSHNYLLTDVKNSLTGDSPEKEVVVATCMDVVVGVMVLKRCVNLDYVLSHFATTPDVKVDITGLHARLVHCVLNPSLKLFSKTFLKEVMRITGYSVFFYNVFPPTVPVTDYFYQSGFNLLEELYPLKPVRPIAYEVKKLGVFTPTPEVLNSEEAFGTYFINRQLCFMVRHVITARIVVVGASDTAMSFLETLVYRKNVFFRNLFLVSPCGLPGEIPEDPKRSAFLPTSVWYDHQILQGLCLHAAVNVVYGRIRHIRRSQKVILLEEDAEIAYDYLILSTGMRYQRTIKKIESIENPPPEEDSTAADGTEKTRIEYEITNRTLLRAATNAFAINDVYDAAVVLKWLGNKSHSIPGQFVVYGNTISAYTCISGIIKANITADHIVLVKSNIEGTNCFKNKSLEGFMVDNLEKIGVTVFDDSVIEVPDFDEIITEVHVLGKSTRRTVKCRALFLCSEKRIDYAVYNACFRARLHFDGHLLVDKTFKTNDDYIYGAGTIVKFYDRYYAFHYSKVEFSSKEMGVKVAESLLKRLIPGEEARCEELEPLPIFTEPTIMCGELPCGYNYLHVEKPKYKYQNLKFPGLLVRTKDNRFVPRRMILSTITRNVRFTERAEDSKIYDSESSSSASDDEEIEREKAKSAKRAEREWKKIIERFLTYEPDLSSPSDTEEEVELYDAEQEVRKKLSPEGQENGPEGQEETEASKVRKIKVKTKRSKGPQAKATERRRRSSSAYGGFRRRSRFRSSWEQNTDEDEPEHFALEFNDFCQVESITCFTKRKIKYGNLIQLYGLHYSYLNNLMERFQGSKPGDLFEFFEQPWCMALYHSSFKAFLRDIHRYVSTLEPRNDSDKELFGTCHRFAYDEYIKKRLEDFLEQHAHALPMYSRVPF